VVAKEWRPGVAESGPSFVRSTSCAFWKEITAPKKVKT
jgi:hypothetical protein